METNYGNFYGATVEALLRQLGRVPYEDCCYDATHCGDDACYITSEYSTYSFTRPDAPACCLVLKTVTSDTVGTTYSVRSKAEWSISEAVALWNPMCYDALDLQLPYKHLLAAAICDTIDTKPCGGCPPNTPCCDADSGTCVLPTCADVEPFCHDNTKTGLRARQLCPNTCGCNDPTSPLALFNTDSGCGDQCVRSGVYRQKLGELPCEDVEKDDPNFAALLDDISAVASTMPSATLPWRHAM